MKSLSISVGRVQFLEFGGQHMRLSRTYHNSTIPPYPPAGQLAGTFFRCSNPSRWHEITCFRTTLCLSARRHCFSGKWEYAERGFCARTAELSGTFDLPLRV